MTIPATGLTSLLGACRIQPPVEELTLEIEEESSSSDSESSATSTDTVRSSTASSKRTSSTVQSGFIALDREGQPVAAASSAPVYAWGFAQWGSPPQQQNKSGPLQAPHSTPVEGLDKQGAVSKKRGLIFEAQALATKLPPGKQDALNVASAAQSCFSAAAAGGASGPPQYSQAADEVRGRKVLDCPTAPLLHSKPPAAALPGLSLDGDEQGDQRVEATGKRQNLGRPIPDKTVGDSVIGQDAMVDESSDEGDSTDSDESIDSSAKPINLDELLDSGTFVQLVPLDESRVEAAVHQPLSAAAAAEEPGPAAAAAAAATEEG